MLLVLKLDKLNLDHLNKKKAIITIAPRSSIIAKAVKNTFNEIGTLDPSKDKIPREKAISVAEGIAHPFRVSLSPKFITI